MTQEAPASPPKSPSKLRRRKEMPEKPNPVGAGDSETDKEYRTSSSNETDGNSVRKPLSVVEEQRSQGLPETEKERSVESTASVSSSSTAREDGKTQFKWKIILAVVGLIFIASIWKICIVDEGWMASSPRANESAVLISHQQAQDQLMVTIKKMKAQYPSQSTHTWLQIYSAISSTLTEPEPRQPSALVLLTPPILETGFTPCLARKVGKAIHSLFGSLTGQQFNQHILQIGPDYLQNAKSLTGLYDELKTYLNNGKVVIASDLQQVNDLDRLMMFHAFCDNSAAPDKRATYIFLLPVPLRIYKKYEWTKENAADISQETLNDAWASVSADKRPALIARITGYIAMINQGDRCSD